MSQWFFRALGGFLILCAPPPAFALSGIDYVKLNATDQRTFLLGITNIYSRYGEIFDNFNSDCANGYNADIFLRKSTTLDVALTEFANGNLDNVEPFIIKYIDAHCEADSAMNVLLHPYITQSDLEDSDAATLFFQGALGGAATIAAYYAPVDTARCVITQYQNEMKLSDDNKPQKNGFLFEQSINVYNNNVAGVAMLMSGALQTLCH